MLQEWADLALIVTVIVVNVIIGLIQVRLSGCFEYSDDVSYTSMHQVEHKYAASQCPIAVYNVT